MRPIALIADRDPEAASAARDIAKAAGLAVETATTVTELLRACARLDPALVVLDVGLDQRGGADLIRVLRLLAQGRRQSRLLLAADPGSTAVGCATQLAGDLGLHVLGAFERPLGEVEIEAAIERCLADSPRLDRAELLRALAERELVVYYQPKIDLAHGAACGAEALLRWQHPERGLLPPASFIPAFEANGLSWKLTHALLDDVCRRIVESEQCGIPLRISFNLSPLVLDDLELPERLAHLVDAAGVAPSSLIVEVTETAEIRSPKRAACILRRIRNAGLELAIDDFGIGYSSFLRLRDLPFSELKIDRSFVMGCDADGRSHAIVRALIGLARDLDLAVCAEGVETARIRDVLRELGCERAQGFLWSRPLPPADLFHWLRNPPAPLSATAEVSRKAR